MFERMVVR